MKSLQFHILSMRELCEKILPISNKAILLGMAVDELPVLLDIESSTSPNILVYDRLEGQGLRLIKTAIEYILKYKKGTKTEFVIISNHSSEWEKLNENGLGIWNKNECIAIVPFWDEVTGQVLKALSEWIDWDGNVKSPLILFIDDLSNLKSLSVQSRKNLRDVLLRGRGRKIHVIGTVSSNKKEDVREWVGGFQSEMYGQSALEFIEMEEFGESVVFWTPRTVL